jgi:hypothetical protein
MGRRVKSGLIAMSNQIATTVREKFSIEFASAKKEVAALKDLLKAVADDLPELVLFESPAPVTQKESSGADPVEELRTLMGAA